MKIVIYNLRLPKIVQDDNIFNYNRKKICLHPAWGDYLLGYNHIGL